MNIFARFKIHHDFTAAEQSIVQYIKERPEDFISEKIEVVAKQCGVSTSAIYRLCKHLGYSGFHELKRSVSSSMAHHKLENNHTSDYNFPFVQKDSFAQVISSVSFLYEHSIQEETTFINVKEIEKASQAIHEAKSIDLYVDSSCYHIAGQFNYKLSKLGKKTWISDLYREQVIRANSSDESHIAIYISYLPTQNYHREIIKTLKGQRTKIILITSYLKHALDRQGTYNFYMVSKEAPTEKISTFSTDISLLYLLDCFYACLYRLDYDRYRNFQMKMQLKIDKT